MSDRDCRKQFLRTIRPSLLHATRLYHNIFFLSISSEITFANDCEFRFFTLRVRPRIDNLSFHRLSFTQKRHKFANGCLQIAELLRDLLPKNGAFASLLLTAQRNTQASIPSRKCHVLLTRKTSDSSERRSCFSWRSIYT